MEAVGDSEEHPIWVSAAECPGAASTCAPALRMSAGVVSFTGGDVLDAGELLDGVSGG